MNIFTVNLNGSVWLSSEFSRLLSFRCPGQARALEAALQPEDHGGGPAVHQQPQRVVSLRWPAAATQGLQQHSEPRPQAGAGEENQGPEMVLGLEGEVAPADGR